ncbi:malate synthase [Cavenderia fasciculata]|uniref:malate synthase n=1 Tax=Cavenderia fasciculata TaxID=261658 RepID=F4Q6D3_CACFS|nr:malate synthase [Cavenderia fasciculata]EGG16443.1 malate synthase [Cavenderia fasciculata]|eukprot:XP_004354843.1 malate synthase [Cavenderia fasciculata]
MKRMFDTLNESLKNDGVCVVAASSMTCATVGLTVLTVDSLRFLSLLHRKFNNDRLQLLNNRINIQSILDTSFVANSNPSTSSTSTSSPSLKLPTLLKETEFIRNDKNWRVEKIPGVLMDRRCDIVCLDVTSKYNLLECIKSGANGVQVDFDDGYAPTWDNGLRAHSNINELAKECFQETDALLIMRPRSLNLDECHVLVDGQPVAGALFDYAMFMFHNGRALASQGRGPFFYLPKLENHREAIWWNGVIVYGEQLLNLTHGTSKVIVLIENILATFEMEEIIYYLRDYIVALNTGRWDYIFSFIKKFGQSTQHIFPDRSCMGLDQPFLASYYRLLVDVCHRRGCLATGGMAPQYPSSTTHLSAEELALVTKGKETEAAMGFDGALVAYYQAVSLCKEAFTKYFPTTTSVNQMDKRVNIDHAQLYQMVTQVPKGTISTKEVYASTYILCNYILSWIRGQGALPLNNIVEDLATAEINRVLLWKWIKYHSKTTEGYVITFSLVRSFMDQITQKMYMNIREKEYLDQAITILLTSRPCIDFMPSILYPFITTIYKPVAKL